MPAFLETLTRAIHDKYKDKLGDICIVLPNRRAILFIKYYLSELLETTSFLPEFYSIEDFVAQTSGFVITDSLHDQFTLYSIHRKLEGENARSVEEFFPYASWMLSDFNEIDMYLVDKDQLYTYLSDSKAMSLWNTEGKPLSDFEKQYLLFFRSIRDYYDGLIESNRNKKMAHQGFAFRQLAEKIDDKTIRWKKIIFAGFNALTPSEEKIITHLQKEGKVEIYWDADEYYLNDPQQEAGHFMRTYFGKLFKEDPRWINRNYSERKDLNITGVPGNTGQIKYAGEIIQRISNEEGRLDKTALVLNDESLLLPMLNSIPSEAGPFNVTMGLSLRHTPLYSLIDHILAMYRNADRFADIKKDVSRTFYSKDLVRLLSHPWIKILMSRNNEESENVLEIIRQGNRIFLPVSDILQLLGNNADNTLSGLFNAGNGPGRMLQSLGQLIRDLRKIFIGMREDDDGGYGVELEYIFRFSNLITRMEDLVNNYDSISTLRTLHMIFRQLAQQEKIAFRGEPLQGLQVMGMLETRTLDFDTVIMLSVNEGTLPSARTPNSFIPYDMKREFGLPTYQHNNAVFSYHFYRLLQRAKEVFLLYNTESDVLGGGEKSRFITQLLHEARKYNPGINIKENLLSIPPPSGMRDHSIQIEKNESIIEKLRQEAEKGFHPSSLSMYINCPLQFYYARLAGVRETDDIEETIDARTLGTVVHESLRTLLDGYRGQLLDSKVFQDAIKMVPAEVERQFAKHYHKDDISFGKNYLVVNVAKKMLVQIFEKETEWLEDGEELIISGLEEPLRMSVDVRGIGKVGFKGTTDRIDRKGGKVRILDYKTGSVETSKLKPKTWEMVFGNPDYKQVFQLLMYSWLYKKAKGKQEDMEAGIISLRAPGNGPEMVSPPNAKEINPQTLEDFEEQLLELIEEIFDLKIPFEQTEDEERCKYCTFSEMCNRIGPKDNY